MDDAGRREEQIFQEAVNLPADQRAAFLDAACAGDTAQRARMDELLAAHAASRGPLDQPPAAVVPDATIDQPFSPRPGTVIAGRYKLLEAIGEGGMGTVWVAEQTEPVRRKVALKLVKPGMDSRQVVARFNAERQALALMDHPNIAKVFDGGITEQGRPFFVMEYVKGVPLTAYCDQARLSVRQRLELFIPACQAVQHAHQKGIIHRDLKPSNILACLYDGQPVPKVIDFGLAKAMHQPLTEQTLHTAHGMMLGTPLYMSPEQAEFNNLDVDTRTDIYSLGVILYELLTGTTPLEKQQFKEAAFQEILRLIKEVEPPKPSTRLSGSASLPSIAQQRSLEPAQLRRSVRGELDWIVMKALDKERSRRYETANGLARDLQRFLHEEAVEACPPSTSYRLRKFARKHRAALTTAAAFASLLLAATTFSLWQASRTTRAEILARKAAEAEAALREQAEVAAKRARQSESTAKTEAKRAKAAEVVAEQAESIAAEEAKRANAQVYRAEMVLAWDAYREGNIAEARRLVEKHRGAPVKGIEWTILDRELASSGEPWAKTGYMKALDLQISADGQVLVAVGNDQVTVYHVSAHDSSGKPPTVIEAWARGHFWPTACALSRDGRQLAYRSRQGELLLRDLSSNATTTMPTDGLAPECLAFSSDSSQTIIAIGDPQGQIRLLDWKSARVVRVCEDPSDTSSQPPATRQRSSQSLTRQTLVRLQFSPDGAWLAAANPDGWVRIWDSRTGELVREWEHDRTMRDVAFSPDGSLVAACHSRQPYDIYLYSLATGRLEGRLTGHEGQVYAVRFLDNVRLVSSSRDNTIRVWNVESGRSSRTIRGHSHYVPGLATNPGGTYLYSASDDGEIRRWALADPQTAAEIDARYYTGVSDLKVIKDGEELIAAQPGSVQTWELATGRLIDELRWDTQAEAFQSEVGMPATPLPPLNPTVENAMFPFQTDMRLAVSPAGILAVSGNGVVGLRSMESGKTRLLWQPVDSAIRGLDFSPEGRFLAAMAVGKSRRLVVWDMRDFDWDAARPLPPIVDDEHGEHAHDNDVAWSPNGSLLATVSGGNVSLWNPGDKSWWHGKSDRNWATCVAWSPDSTKLVISDEDGSIDLLDVDSKTERPFVQAHAGRVWNVAFTFDGTALVSTSGDDTVGIWDVATGELRARLPGHTDGAYALLLTPDKKRLITGGLWDGKIRVWRLE